MSPDSALALALGAVAAAALYGTFAAMRAIRAAGEAGTLATFKEGVFGSVMARCGVAAAAGAFGIELFKNSATGAIETGSAVAVAVCAGLFASSLLEEPLTPVRADGTPLRPPEEPEEDDEDEDEDEDDIADRVLEIAPPGRHEGGVELISVSGARDRMVLTIAIETDDDRYEAVLRDAVARDFLAVLGSERSLDAVEIDVGAQGAVLGYYVAFA